MTENITKIYNMNVPCPASASQRCAGDVLFDHADRLFGRVALNDQNWLQNYQYQARQCHLFWLELQINLLFDTLGRRVLDPPPARLILMMMN